MQVTLRKVHVGNTAKGSSRQVRLSGIDQANAYKCVTVGRCKSGADCFLAFVSPHSKPPVPKGTGGQVVVGGLSHLFKDTVAEIYWFQSILAIKNSKIGHGTLIKIYPNGVPNGNELSNMAVMFCQNQYCQQRTIRMLRQILARKSGVKSAHIRILLSLHQAF